MHVNLREFAIGNELNDTGIQYYFYVDYALGMRIIKKSQSKLDIILGSEDDIKLCDSGRKVPCMAAYMCYEFPNMKIFLNKRSGRQDFGVDGIKLFIYVREYDFICYCLGNSKWVSSRWVHAMKWNRKGIGLKVVKSDEAGMGMTKVTKCHLSIRDGHIGDDPQWQWIGKPGNNYVVMGKALRDEAGICDKGRNVTLLHELVDAKLIADEAKLVAVTFLLSLERDSFVSSPKKTSEIIKEQFVAIVPDLEQLWTPKRVKLFFKKLKAVEDHLQELQKEKSLNDAGGVQSKGLVDGVTITRELAIDLMEQDEVKVEGLVQLKDSIMTEGIIDGGSGTPKFDKHRVLTVDIDGGVELETYIFENITEGSIVVLKDNQRQLSKADIDNATRMNYACRITKTGPGSDASNLLSPRLPYKK